MTRVVGLTGNIAAGKSTVAAIMRRMGIPVIDADAIVHELQRPGTAAFRAIVRHFGGAVVLVDGTLDRVALRQRILENPSDKLALEAIIHPAVFERRTALVHAAAELGAELVVIEVPLLYEADDPRHYDAIILVDAPIAERRRRLIVDRGIPPETADRLIASQLSAESKRMRATIVIDNDGTLEELEKRTLSVVETLTS